MNKLTYQQAYDKIIQAYFKDEIRPLEPLFCFCGTLSQNSEWAFCHKSNDAYPYSVAEYCKMERALFSSFHGFEWRPCLCTIYKGSGDPEEYINQNEQALFEGMCAALEVLKQIHRERGENVDDVPVFKKRELVKVV